MGQFSKKWEDLNFSDNYIFCKVMQNPTLCIKLLEILLHVEIEKIEYLKTEHPIDEYYNSRGIRMDVYVKDSTRIFNLKMQTGNYDDLPLRARYYQSASDISSTPRRTKFMDLRETYIIFLCKEDPFNAGLPLYTVMQQIKEGKNLNYNDKTHKLFYNASAYNKVEDRDIRDVLKFIYTFQSSSSYTKQLETCVNYAKVEPTFKDEYMYFEDILEEEKELAREAGLAEGLAKLKSIIKFQIENNKTPEQISKDFGISLEEVNSLLQ